MNLGINGKTALVTGSDKNTGQIIASSLMAAGAEVIIHSNEAGKASATAASIGAPFSVEGNIADEAGCEAVLDQLKSQNLGVDILVNNYGTASFGKWGSTDTSEWLDMYQKNVLSVARLVQGLVPGMKNEGWGRIINLGTIGSHRPGHRMPHYYASKGALANLGVSLCQDLSGTGITVNTVSPGLIHTPDLEAGYRARAAKKGWGDEWPEIEQRIVEEDFPNPCGRLANREEIADLVTFLSSERAGFINGQNIRIDGGAISYV
jgi:3-oxoacyl-[acyl-carrier protein] reductase